MEEIKRAWVTYNGLALDYYGTVGWNLPGVRYLSIPLSTMGDGSWPSRFSLPIDDIVGSVRGKVALYEREFDEFRGIFFPSEREFFMFNDPDRWHLEKECWKWELHNPGGGPDRSTPLAEGYPIAKSETLNHLNFLLPQAVSEAVAWMEAHA